MLKRLHSCFSRVLSDSFACLTIWSMIETHVSLQSSRLYFGGPLDFVLSLVAHTIPKLIIRLRDKTERWNRLLDVFWLSSLCLTQNGLTCYVILSLLSTQQLQRTLGALHLSWCMGNRLGYLLISFWIIRAGCLVQLISLSKQLVQDTKDHLKQA